MDQLQIIWLYSLKQNHDLLKREPKQMILLCKCYIVVTEKLEYGNSACLQEKKKKNSRLFCIHSVENMTNSRSELIYEFKNSWEEFTSAAYTLGQAKVRKRLCFSLASL